jgi:hypothetical protein
MILLQVLMLVIAGFGFFAGLIVSDDEGKRK